MREVFVPARHAWCVDELTGDRKRRFKDSAYAAMAQIATELADARRLELCDLLAQRTWRVGELARETSAQVDVVEAELARLAERGLVDEVEGSGFRLRSSAVRDILVGLQRLARESPGVQALLADYIPAEGALSEDEIVQLTARVADGRAVLLDVRPAREHDAGSVPGAVSAPIEEIDAVAAGLAPGVEVVTMCRGPFCCWAEVAASRLRERGVRARSVPAGAHELRAPPSG